MKRFYTFFVILISLSCWISIADAQTIRMPDANLAAVVRNALGLAPNTLITRQEIQRLTFLDAQGYKIREVTGQRGVIRDLTGLEYATQLTRLWLNNNEVRNLSPLARLTQLEELLIWNNQISDLSPLARLTKLKLLGIADNLINNLHFLAGLTQLQDLSVSVRRINDLRRHVDLTQLERLGIWGQGSQISDLNLLANLTQLRSLEVTNAQIRDLHFLERLTQLEQLHLRNNQIRDLKPLSGLTRLSGLALGSNQISDLKPLAGLTKLTWLSLSYNQIRDVTPLAGLTNLESLRLRENPIQDASPLASLTKLEYVDIEIPRIPTVYIRDDMETSEPTIVGGILRYRMLIRNAEDVTGFRLTYSYPRDIVSTKSVGWFDNMTHDDKRRTFISSTLPRGQSVRNVAIFEFNAVSGGTGELRVTGTLTTTQGKVNVDIQFPIMISSIQGETPPVSGDVIPDPNLAAAVRKALGLGANARITKQKMQKLTKLEANSKGIKNLTGLEHATQLTGLFLNDNQIRNLNPLSGLTRLKELGLDRNQISNIKPLTGLTQLELLHIGSNQLKNKGVQLLTSLTQLKVLTLFDNQIINIKPLANLTRLEKLWLYDNKIRDVSPLAGLVNLETLHLSGNPITNTEPLAKLKKLKDVDIKITTPTAVAIPDKNLAAAVREALGLGAKATITKQAMPKLTSLNASDRQISDLAGLEYATELTDLDLGRNQITNFTPLAELPKLRKLYLWTNEISDLSVLPQLPKLELLDLNWNRISDVSPLAGFTNLKELWLQGNNLVDTSTLFQLRGGTFPPDEEITVKEEQDNNGRAYTLLIFGSLDLSVRIQSDVTIFSSANSVSKELPTNAIVSISPTPVESPAIGEELTLNLNITGGEAVVGYQLTLQFDPTALRYVDSSNGDYLPTGAFFVPPVVNRGSIELASTALSGVNKGDGTLATVTFEVLEVKASTLTLSETLLSDSQGNTFRPQVEDGKVTEPPELKADVTGDGVVNIQDLVLVASRFGQTGQNSADVNGDGVINIADLVLVAGALGASTGAPSLNPGSLGMLTAADVHEWLSQAYQLNSSDIGYRQGLLVLERLLAALTPKETTLLPNYPNPFNPETWIPYHLANASNVKITIYDTRGTLVRRLELGHQPAGYYTSRSRAAYWDGQNTLGERVASGIYFYQLQADNVSLLRKMLILK